MKRLLLLLLMPMVIAQATPPLPIGYWGYLESSGYPVQGAQITVKTTYYHITTTKLTGENGLYSVVVPWDDPATGQREGVQAGETLYFYVGADKVGETTVGNQGDNVRFDLELASTGGSSSGRSASPSGAMIIDPQDKDEKKQEGSFEEAESDETTDQETETIENQDTEASGSYLDQDNSETSDTKEDKGFGIKYYIPIFVAIMLVVAITIMIKKRGMK